MQCVIDFGNLKFNFMQNKYNQRILLEILVCYAMLDLSQISKILNLPIQKLIDVHQGLDFLERYSALNLGQLFLLTLSNPGTYF